MALTGGIIVTHAAHRLCVVALAAWSTRNAMAIRGRNAPCCNPAWHARLVLTNQANSATREQVRRAVSGLSERSGSDFDHFAGGGRWRNWRALLFEPFKMKFDGFMNQR
jgi:hypothetical protein